MVIEVKIDEITKKVLSKALSLGLEVNKTGSLIVNESMAFHVLSEALKEYGIIYVSIKEAFDRYPDIIEKYGLKMVRVDPRNIDDGVLLYIPRNTKVLEPIYTCFALARRGVVQRIYNLYVVEDYSEAVAAKGCLTIVPEGAHSGITEIYVGRHAKLSSIMIHNWMPEVRVSALARARLLEEAVYYDYYVNLTHVKRIGSLTEIYLEGNSARAQADMILIGRGRSTISHNVMAYLNAPKTSVELISRMLGDGESRVESTTRIIANAPNTRGHIECQGLQLSNSAVLTTKPVLESHIDETSLTHEASIGKISEEELEYLMAKGFREEEAISLIVRGFLELGFQRVPDKLKPVIERVLDMLSQARM